jgi:hypothetical protein
MQPRFVNTVYLNQWQVAAEFPERDQELMALTLKIKEKKEFITKQRIRNLQNLNTINISCINRKKVFRTRIRIQLFTSMRIQITGAKSV